MDVDAEAEVTSKDDPKALRKDEPTAATKVKSAAASSSASALEKDAGVIDVEKPEEPIDVDKPAGKPAEKKMPIQKAPETKAMPRSKAPRLDHEVDKALKKLEAVTEEKEQAVWLDPEDMGSRIPRKYCGTGG